MSAELPVPSSGGPSPAPPGKRLRDSRGFTLVEVLLTTLILSAIMVPVLAWSVVALQRSGDTTASDSIGFTELSRFLKRDIPGAVEAVAKPVAGNCSATSGTDGVVLALTPGDSETRRIEYVSRLVDGKKKLIRSVFELVGGGCPPGGPSSSVVVAKNLEPLANGFSVDATCSTPAGQASNCQIVTLKLKASNAAPVTLTQTRRSEKIIASDSAGSGIPLPRIDTTPDPPSGARPFTVIFSALESDLNGAASATYSWDLDGVADQAIECPDEIQNSPTVQCTYNPTFVAPAQSKTYAVTLRIITPTGEGTATTEVTVRNSRPNAVIAIDSDPVYRDRVIGFSAEGSFDPDGPGEKPVAYEWDFNGDGVVDSTNVADTYTYSNITFAQGQLSKTFNVRLTVVDSDGARVTTSRAVEVRNNPPIVTVDCGTAPCISATLIQFGRSITFSADAVETCPTFQEGTLPDKTCDLDGQVTSYEWDFGNGITRSGPNPGSVPFSGFDQLGNEVREYTVTLRVTDNDGESSTFTTKVSVNKAPKAVVAQAGITNPGVTVFSRSSRGDLVVNGPIVNGTNSTNFAIDFFALLPANQQFPCPDPLPTPLLTSCDPDGTITGYKWTGQSVFGASASTSRPITAPGTYNQELTVIDNDGATDTSTIVVKVNKPPTPSFAQPTSVFRKKPVTFSSTSTDTDAGSLAQISSCAWKFYVNGVLEDSAITCDATWTPTKLGNGTAQLDVTDSQGGTARKISPVFVVQNQLPIVEVVPGPRNEAPFADYAVLDGEQIGGVNGLSCANSLDPDLANVKFDPTLTCAWDFEFDGVNFNPGAIGPSSANVNHVYTRQTRCVTSQGKCIYKLKLRVTDIDGGFTDWGPYTVKVNRPPTISQYRITDPANGVRSDPDANGFFNFTAAGTATDVDGFPKGYTYFCVESDPVTGAWPTVAVNPSFPLPTGVTVGDSGTLTNRTDDPSNITYAVPPGTCRFNTRGTKRIILQVFDNDFAFVASDPATGSVRANLKPIAKPCITSPTTLDSEGKAVVLTTNPLTNPWPVSFRDCGSNDPDGAPGYVLSYKWTWNSGVTATFPTTAGPFNQTFSNQGQKDLTLVVTDAEGTKSDPVVVSIRANNLPNPDFARVSSPDCSAMRTASGVINPTSSLACRGVPVVWDAGPSSLRPATDTDSPVVAGSRIASYRWVVQEDDGSIANLNTSSFTRTYNNLGARTALLYVTDTDGVENPTPLTRGFTVVDAPPIATFTVSPEPPRRIYSSSADTLTVNFNASGSFDPDGVPTGGGTLTYAWDFGDGSTVAAGAPGAGILQSHTYTAAGRYQAKLTVRDKNGTGITATFTREVLLNQIPIAGIVPPVKGNSLNVTLDGSLSVDPAPEGITGSLTYAWTVSNLSGTVVATATGKNPTVTLPARGTYTATLVVTDVDGAVSAPVNAAVVVNLTPTAIIAGGPRIVLNAPYSNTFDGRGSTDDEGAANLTYAWDFGDPSSGALNTSAQGNPAHTFSASAIGTTVTVSLTVTDRFGESNSTTQLVKVNRPPTALIGPVSITPERRFPAAFDGTGSTDPDGSVAALIYAWNFGDPSSGANNVSALASPTHVFNSNGNYTVTLIVTDVDGGVSAAVTRVVTVTDRKPVASFTTNPGGDPVFVISTGTSLDVAFDARGSTDPYSSVLQFQWNFGDGSTIAFGSQSTPTHSYTGIGRFTVTLTVKDPVTGLTGTATRDIIHNGRPVAVISPADTYRNGAPTTVNFNGSGSNDPNPDGGPIASYSWNFGDPSSGPDNTATTVAPSHTYTAAGAYLVTLTVTDKYGTTGTTTATVRVNTKPTAVIAGPLVVNPPYLAAFDGRGSLDDAGAANLSYAWDFGDPSSGAANTSTSPNPSHTFSSATVGTSVIVTLTVTDQFFETSTAQLVVKVNRAPTAAIGPDVIRAKVGFATTFDASASTDPDGDSSLLTYAWNFGDSGSAQNTSTSRIPVHVYGATGTYTVSLTVTDQNNLASATVTRNVTVTVNQAPTAAITPPNPPLYRNAFLSFDGSPSTDSDGLVSSYAWTFSDGGTATGRVVTHKFTQAGAASATLIVKDDNGVASAPATVTFTVTLKDSDGDSYEDSTYGGNDCNDASNAINPGAADPLDGPRVDSNCDEYDGIVTDEIFVSTSGTLDVGDPDAGGCGKPTSPCLLVTDGVVQARDFGRRAVLVAAGDYQRLSVGNGSVTVRGGYAGDFKGGSSAATRVLGSAEFSGRVSAATFTNLTGPVLVRDITFKGADATGPSQTTYGVIVQTGGNNLTLQDVNIIGGKGGTGTLGVDGANATQTPALAGGVGQNSRQFSGCNTSSAGGGFGVDGGGSGGQGGQGDGSCPFGTGSRGGSSGANASVVGPGNCGLGGSGGGGGGNGSGGNGNTGQTGCAGQPGGAGVGGGSQGSPTFGTIVNGLWFPLSSEAGGNGTTGFTGGAGGGGGGGGGTDNDCATTFIGICITGDDSWGAGGGGGGSGGVAALTRGTGGGSGGASIAVFLVGTRPTFTNVQITVGTGGTGGKGGAGSIGQPGGAGGAGGNGRCNGGAPLTGACGTVSVGGGAGGTGGVGGRGGASGAGGGGAGGPAIGVLATGSAPIPSASISGGVSGTGGAGGAAASGGSAGLAGASGQRLNQATLQ